jgi:hypothetical protein
MRHAWQAVFVAAVALAVPATAQANEVTHWNRIAMNTLVAFPGPAGGAPPALQIHMGMTQGAVYDAVNATEPKHFRPYLLNRRVGARASKEAAAATAAYRVLSSIVSGVPLGIPFLNRADLLTMLAAERDASLGAIPESPFKRQGKVAGNAAADAMIAARQNDGRYGASQWHPDTRAGHWWPLPDPITGLPVLDPTPWVGGVRPFMLTSPSQFRTAGPNALDTDAWVTDYKEVKAIGRATGSTRSTDETHNALFWQSNGGPALLWNDVADDIVEGSSMSMADSARLLGMLNLGGADAAINCWNDKYHFDFWRPWNAITRDDGNPDTDIDLDWTALLVAPYPEHPSGHLCLDSVQLRVLTMFFGDNVHYGVTSSRFGGETRFFDQFSGALAEITDARIWAGLHFRTADVQGKQLGENVARYMAENYFQPVGNH